MLMHEAVES